MIYLLPIAILFLLFFIIYGFPLSNSLPVLMYHSISCTETSDLTVLQSELDKQFKYLQDNKYQTIFCDEIDSKKKQVLLTFDDGYLNNQKLLVPLLIKYNFKATIFIPFEFIGQKDQWWTNSQEIMSIEELKALDARYVQLGWHSYSHQSYRTLSIEQIENDVKKSVEVIRENTLNVAPIFAYPFGNYPKNKIQQKQLFNLFEHYGIQLAFRIGNKLNNLPLKNRYLIKRIDIRGTDSQIAFRWKLKFGRVKPF